jgi:hypothetical protein
MIDERMEKNGDRKSRWHQMESADMERPARASGNRPEPTRPKSFGGCLVSLCLASHLHYLHLSRCRQLLNGKPACTGQPPNSPLLLTGLNAHLHHSRSWLAGCTFSGSSRCCSCLLISNPGFTALACSLWLTNDLLPTSFPSNLRPRETPTRYIACSSSSEHLIHTLFHSYTI